MPGLTLTALIFHIVAGTGALLAGSMALLTSKGSPRHRRWGRWFQSCMTIVLASAGALTILGINPYFAALTLSATMGVFSGLRVLRRKRPDLDPAHKPATADWAITILLMALSCALLGYTALGGITQRQPMIYGLTGATILYAAYDLMRFFRPLSWPFFPRLWLYEHLIKMMGAFAAVLSAFSGSVLTFFPVPDPWKQLWPTILFYILAMLMVRRLARTSAAADGGEVSAWVRR